MSGELTLRALKATFLSLPPLLRLIIVLVIVDFIVMGSTVATQQAGARRAFSNTAVVKSVNIGVYWDVACSKPVATGIDWGIIEPGTNKTVVLYVRNEGNWETSLSIQAANWSPLQAEQFMSLTIDYQDQPFKNGDVRQATLILSVAQETRDVDFFSFDVIIEAIS